MKELYKYLTAIAILIIWVFISTAYSANDDLKRSEKIINETLPLGWVIVKIETEQIPWGHHWCKKYIGVTGIKVIARGVEPVSSNFLTKERGWEKIIIGKESLEIWIMPGDYRENWMDWLFCIHRPIQPSVVIELNRIRVYARPAGYSDIEGKKIFDHYLSISSAVESPESPWNDPNRLSWKGWKSKLRSAFEKEYSE
jgi:hypothetical protein